MTKKTIHIHLHRGSVVRDAGFDESKHKRDHGKFASVQGSGDPGFHKSGMNSSPAMRHHDEAEGHHHAAAQAEYVKNGATPLHEAHKAAAKAHSHALAEAKNKAQGFESGYESSAKKAAEASAKTMPAAPQVKPATSKMAEFGKMLGGALRAQGNRPGGAPGSGFQGKGEPSALEKQAQARGGYGSDVSPEQAAVPKRNAPPGSTEVSPEQARVPLAKPGAPRTARQAMLREMGSPRYSGR